MQELLAAVDRVGGRFLLTADHGNAEDMVQVQSGAGRRHTAAVPRCRRLPAARVHCAGPLPPTAALTHAHSSPHLLQRDKAGKPVVKDGKPVELTSHTLNPVPCAIGGPGLPDAVRFRCAAAPPLRCRCAGRTQAAEPQLSCERVEAGACTGSDQPRVPLPACRRDDLPHAGLANVTATFINLLGFEVGPVGLGRAASLLHPRHPPHLGARHRCGPRPRPLHLQAPDFWEPSLVTADDA